MGVSVMSRGSVEGAGCRGAVEGAGCREQKVKGAAEETVVITRTGLENAN